MVAYYRNNIFLNKQKLYEYYLTDAVLFKVNYG